MDKESTQRALLKNVYSALGEPTGESRIEGIGEIRTKIPLAGIYNTEKLELLAYTAVSQRVANTNRYEWRIQEYRRAV